MKIIYEEGPETIIMGIAGQFKRGEPRDVPDEIAKALLKKQTIKFMKVDEKPSRKKEE